MSQFGVFWRKLLFDAAFKTPIRQLFYGPQFMFSPSQLMRICELAREAAQVHGEFFEIGACWGSTTIFVNQYLQEQGIEVRYTIIDTFSGFTKNDADVEIEERGISPRIRHAFTLNDFEWVKQRLRENGLPDVRCVKIDAALFDFENVKSIAFALIDMDLYAPTKNILPKIYAATAPKGIIIVDNCDPNHVFWNGAYQAYKEFAASENIQEEIVLGKLGIIRKK